MSSWTTLPWSWKLEDVQAVLNIIVTAISGIAIFVLTRCYWSLSARVAAQGKVVPVSFLLTLNTPGEAIDVLLLLKSHVIQHWNIVSQSLIVISLSITTILSGPIAKYSTRLTHVVVQTEVNGLLAGRTDNSIPDSQVAWNLTQMSLDHANFPIDELLDYLPDTSKLWVDRLDEWNNSWSMTCEPVSHVGIDHGNYDSADFYTNATLIKDLLICMYAANYSDWDEASGPFGTYRTVNMSMASLHLHNAPKNDSDDYAPCRFGQGAVGSAFYTRVDCALRLTNNRIQDPAWIAFPDIGDVFNIHSSMVGNYFTRFKQESMAGDEISVISPRDLQRFYPTYMVTKDTQLKRPVQRKISVKVVAVQLSNGFIAVFSILALFICLGGAAHVLLLFRNRGAMDLLPQSKLDWLLECIISRSPSRSGVDSRGPIPSRVADAGAVVPLHISAGKKRAQFEAAVYSTMWTGDVDQLPDSPDIHAQPSELPDKGVEPRQSSASGLLKSQRTTPGRGTEEAVRAESVGSG
ncbi:uncharacterized protein Z520_03087 [Fonsecaea multimorphosa CBS 102226]|uniref:Uncharacterized protein n=1 Tax=Fonsecaea multimorphosa CBS 102226 TaxID=1442371 RepID=A0A0D2KE04_9EURO|nr:uncharacterized protein Z520_03087 [Fonsecaea multimorphosa CBS 102226]KIY01535.1 hypothetical protein Z520_03087 [Fonsecaea multimorphosa CBS 102226]